MRGLNQLARRSPDHLRCGGARLRVRPWHLDSRVAHLTVVAGSGPVVVGPLVGCLHELAERGYTDVMTAALATPEQTAFRAAGFEPRQHLELLVHNLRDLDTPSPGGGARLRRGRRRDWADAATVDHAAFRPSWWLDEAGIADALDATPTSRLRMAAMGGRAVGYAIAGRAARDGYLQRLAVHPDHQGLGLGRALVIDALQWVRHRGARRAVVNTQTDNERALALYRAIGFRSQCEGLAVLGRLLDP